MFFFKLLFGFEIFEAFWLVFEPFRVCYALTAKTTTNLMASPIMKKNQVSNIRASRPMPVVAVQYPRLFLAAVTGMPVRALNERVRGIVRLAFANIDTACPERVVTRALARLIESEDNPPTGHQLIG